MDHCSMTAKEFADIASALAWPVTAVAFLAAFFKPLQRILERLAATLAIKTVKLRAFGAEIELTPEQAKRALDELLQDIAESTNELSPQELVVFKRIIDDAGRTTVAQLFPGFTRDSKGAPAAAQAARP